MKFFLDKKRQRFTEKCHSQQPMIQEQKEKTSEAWFRFCRGNDAGIMQTGKIHDRNIKQLIGKKNHRLIRFT